MTRGDACEAGLEMFISPPPVWYGQSEPLPFLHRIINKIKKVIKNKKVIEKS